jgi:hypothetical protein
MLFDFHQCFYMPILTCLQLQTRSGKLKNGNRRSTLKLLGGARPAGGSKVKAHCKAAGFQKKGMFFSLLPLTFSPKEHKEWNWD